MAAGSTYTPIATTTASGSTTSISFTSIPSTYTDLVIVTNITAASGGADVFDLTFNSDTGSNYSSTRLVGNGSTVNSDRQTNATKIYIGLISSTARNSDIYQIMNYANTTTYKTCLGRANLADNQTRVTVGLWRSTAAITSLTLTDDSGINIASGSTFTLYGITAA